MMARGERRDGTGGFVQVPGHFVPAFLARQLAGPAAAVAQLRRDPANPDGEPATMPDGARTNEPPKRRRGGAKPGPKPKRKPAKSKPRGEAKPVKRATAKPGRNAK